MSCCADPRAGFERQMGTLAPAFAEAVGDGEDGRRQLALYVPDIHCAGCIGRIEKALNGLGDGVESRVNFTRKTVTMTWPQGRFDPARGLAALRDLGYAPQPVPKTTRVRDEKGRELLRCLAVAGFGAMNVMLLSVSVWAGADGTTAAFLNWFAALIALPCITYAARPFFRSALAAVRGWRLNMDVPISLAIILAAALSLFQTIAGHGEETYFDAAITLTFFLLAGRVLDHMTRERARQSVSRLAAMRSPFAHVVGADGSAAPVPVEMVKPGDRLQVAAGERVPVDARVEDGGAFDLSLATGESDPVARGAGDEVLAGALAVTGPVHLTAARPAEDSYLAQLTALQAAAEGARSRPARIADQAAQVYAPVVHLVALVTFVGWLLVGQSVAASLTTAIAVLIITCPCALGLAVPVVHVAACDRLFRRGLAIKDGAALERLRHVDEVVFDKTGTLTVPALDPDAPVPAHALAAAAALARHSTHPVSRAVLRAAEARELELPRVVDVAEHRGQGVSGRIAGERVYLGRGAPPWDDAEVDAAFSFHAEGAAPVALPVTETIRDGAEVLVAALKGKGLPVTVLSGDRPEAVAAVASALGIEDWRARCAPKDKVAFLQARTAAGARPLMVGDGLNDGPALAAAAASIAPAEASDLSRTAADIVMTRDRLDDVVLALETAGKAHRLVLQNFGIAAGYNMVAIPLAVLGYASPLAAAIAMSTSSILVTLNALRLVRIGHAPAGPRGEMGVSTAAGPAAAPRALVNPG
jgi:Cu2+-exporting ATPase